ncbi:FxLYD domain-containing protein [Senegalimassilia faecalis]|uniref:FxLYD domain-containing protein n=1 Tax=Senegalimassilia faecalis TaxID=2509433 RepID=UPI003077026B
MAKKTSIEWSLGISLLSLVATLAISALLVNVADLVFPDGYTTTGDGWILTHQKQSTYFDDASLGESSLDKVSIEGMIRNTSNETHSYLIHYTLKDENGNAIDEAVGVTDDIKPNDTEVYWCLSFNDWDASGMKDRNRFDVEVSAL